MARLPSPEAVSASPRLALRAGVAWTLGGQVVYSAAQWGMVALLARLGRPQDVGVFSLGLALGAPLFLALGLQLRSVQATDTAATSPFRDYFTLRALSMGLGLGVTAGLCALYPQAAGAVWWVGVAKALEGLSDVMYGLMQRHERLDWVSRSTLSRGLLGLGLLGGLFALTGSVAWGAAGLAAAGAVTLLAYDLPHARRLEPGRWLTRRIPPALPRLAAPLGLVVGLISLSSTLPRLFIERSLGHADLGVYSALAYVTVAGSIVVTALGTALTTRLAALFAAREQAAFVTLTLRLLALAAVFGAGLSALAWTAGGPLLRALYGPEYASQTGTFVWLTVSGALGYLASCLGFAVTAARRFREQVPVFVVTTLALALACAWGVPRAGLVGAAQASLLASALQLLGSVVVVAQALRQGPARPTSAPHTP